MIVLRRSLLIVLTVILLGLPAVAQVQQPALDPSTALTSALARLDASLPKTAAAFATEKPEAIAQAASAVERAAYAVSDYDDNTPSTQMLKAIDQLLAAKEQVEQLLERTLALRSAVAAKVQGDQGRDSVRNFLRTMASLTDLSARVRYVLVDALNDVASEVADKPNQREALIDLACRYKSGAGAYVMGVVLNDPGADAPQGVGPVSSAAKLKLLKLFADSGQLELVPVMARFVRDPKAPPALVIAAAETLRDIGIPQDPRIGQDPTLPAPDITARELLAIVSRLDAAKLDDELKGRREALVTLLTTRARQGLTEESYRLGKFDVRPGDWLLMRNPSPYNLFTDLSPGLFTHVGVIAMETAADGVRRMVVVDLPETGNRIPATNVDTFVKRTRHFVVLRHPDPEVAAKMGQVAASVIGNESQFDLNFRADRVVALKGQSLSGKKIFTYCAGLLQLCAQETAAPMSDFFPLHEYPGPGKTRDNCAKIGIQFGDEVVSPTGALFSPKLELVGRREPMYDPRRDIEEAIYDHFAQKLDAATLTPSPDTYQSLRQKLAETSRTSPALAKALASAANVNVDMDLVSAAKAAAVVEALDDIATGASERFLQARSAIVDQPEGAQTVQTEQVAPSSPMMGRRPLFARAQAMQQMQQQQGGQVIVMQPGPRGRLGQARAAEMQQTQQDMMRTMNLQAQHAELARRWAADDISPRELRLELVKFYIKQGCDQLDARFFSGNK